MRKENRNVELEIMPEENLELIQEEQVVEPTVEETEILEENETEIQEEPVVEPTIEEDQTEIQNEPEIVETKEATVAGCTKLNVRKEPNKDSEVLCVIEEGVNLTVIDENSNEEFYKVLIPMENEVREGYCMKKFISIK